MGKGNEEGGEGSNYVIELKLHLDVLSKGPLQLREWGMGKVPPPPAAPQDKTPPDTAQFVLYLKM